MYDYDASAILIHPLKMRQAAKINEAWTTLHHQLTHYGHVRKYFFLDNEVSSKSKKTFLKNKVTFQAVLTAHILGQYN